LNRAIEASANSVFSSLLKDNLARGPLRFSTHDGFRNNLISTLIELLRTVFYEIKQILREIDVDMLHHYFTSLNVILKKKRKPT